MQQGQLSSGDVIADRRADYAKMLDESGDAAAAAELMDQALELTPHWAAGWFRLGEYRQKAGERSSAVKAYRRAIELDPQDIFGASLKLALLDETPVPALPPSRYVERLFDDYASRFEASLIEKLEYSVPEKLADMIAKGGRTYELAVDLGCGTGLLGPKIKPLVAQLEGFDLSHNMLAKAAEKSVYDHLAQADLSRSLQESGIFDNAGRARADLITAADVLMYLGDLKAVFEIVASLAADSADFAFSVEDAGSQDGFRLAQSLRYAHSEAYVRSLCDSYGFHIVQHDRTVIRKDGGKSIIGILFLARKVA
ncbi:class I SAM-dependent DNA methyltransferase [Oryzifoliimicrobium ureilyticus]|uniref:class I SAM-dependent DNA methyltransferase n=1 Tax=Oryzifoliimicrobium ureilyticus TaxID=3113724 RepID=UPI003076026E